MLHYLFTDDPWFAPKRFGYGAGLPIAWQGWALLASYAGLVIGLATLARGRPDLWAPLAIPAILAATLVLIVVSKRHTRGGWRWRWGGED
ncbi:MAG: hypothetical protein IE933_05300 [Sphingomonadales bacterium]|nr:hypothetical protein [Sphingomonadales bacterium]MBD3775149.1 hypothetical protein [Paracoccaceae bacterium]